MAFTSALVAGATDGRGTLSAAPESLLAARTAVMPRVNAAVWRRVRRCFTRRSRRCAATTGPTPLVRSERSG